MIDSFINTPNEVPVKIRDVDKSYSRTYFCELKLCTTWKQSKMRNHRNTNQMTNCYSLNMTCQKKRKHHRQ